MTKSLILLVCAKIKWQLNKVYIELQIIIVHLDHALFNRFRRQNNISISVVLPHSGLVKSFFDCYVRAVVYSAYVLFIMKLKAFDGTLLLWLAIFDLHGGLVRPRSVFY